MRLLHPLFRFAGAAVAVALNFAAVARGSIGDARDALSAHDYATALSLAQAAVTEEPNRFGYFVLGSAQIKSGQLEAAEKTAAEIIRLDPVDPLAVMLRAELAVARGRGPDALKLFDQILSADAVDTEALTGRGHAKFALKLADRGRADFDRAIELSDSSTEAFFFRSQLLATAGDIPGAVSDLSRILQLLPGQNEARLLRAEHYLTLKLRRLALGDIEVALESAPRDPALLALRTRAEGLPEISAAESESRIAALLRESAAAIGKNDPAAAASAFALAQLAAENNTPGEAVEPHLYIARGDLLAAVGAMEAAKDDYRKARYSGELVPAALLRLARLQFAEKKFSDALESIAVINPDLDRENAAAAFVLSARVHLAMAEESGDADELVPAFEALKTAAQLDAALTEIGQVRNEIVASRKLRTREVSKLQGEHLPAALARAHALAKSDEFDASRALYDRLLQVNPTNPAVYEARLATVAQFGMNDPRTDALKAIVAELRAPAPSVPLSGSPADLVLARANLAVHQRPDLSRPYIERSRLHLARAQTSKNNRDVAAALADARHAARLDRYDPQACVALTEALIAQKKTVDLRDWLDRPEILIEAFAAADRAVALAPDDIALVLWRGDLERDHGIEILQCDSRALRFYARACRLDPQSTQALYAHATAASKIGNHAEAVSDYRKVLTFQPRNLYARYELGVAQLYAKAYTDAVASFSSLQQTLALAGDRTSADAVETQQLHAIALAAAGDDRSETIAKDILTRSEWIGNADAALQNLTQKSVPTAQLARLLQLTGTPNPHLPKVRKNQHETELDAAPR